MRVVLIDGYVDEPAVLGVPPYISTYARYIAGTFLLKGYDIQYYTIDQVRSQNLWNNFCDYNFVVVLGGLTVPGHYLGGTPITPKEVEKIFNSNRYAKKIITGSIGRAYSMKGGTFAKEFDFSDAEYIEDIPTYFLGKDYISAIRESSLAGAQVVKQHQNYPHLIAEIEVSLGCERRTFCTFCSEPILHRKFFSRPVKDVIDEIEILYKYGVKAFRLGRSANIFAYGSDFNGNRINPEIIEELYFGIRNVASELEVLHTDNANPSYISRNLNQSTKILETIVKYNTEGDILSFGVESFDERVRKINNIDGAVEDIDVAVKLVNEIGGVRSENGVPKLLPGINLIFGLPGETKKTYEINYKKLLEYLNSGLILRRINLRQVMIFNETPLWYLSKRKVIKYDKRLFEHYKYLIRTNIDNPMLEKVFPIGTVIKNVLPETRNGKWQFGRPLGTYPILIGVPYHFSEPTDLLIVDHGFRSITGIRRVPIEKLTAEELSAIPGISKNGAEKLKRGETLEFSEKTIKILEKLK